MYHRNTFVRRWNGFLKTVWEDVDIWEHQIYVERPRWPRRRNAIWPCVSGPEVPPVASCECGAGA